MQDFLRIQLALDLREQRLGIEPLVERLLRTSWKLRQLRPRAAIESDPSLEIRARKSSNFSSKSWSPASVARLGNIWKYVLR